MIFILDNFFTPDVLTIVGDEIKKLEFFDKDSYPHKQNLTANYPGKRTDNLTQAHPLLDSYILRHIERSGAPFVGGNWVQNQYAYLRLEEDNAFEYRHTDPYDWAYLIYLSDTNFNSGTRFYESMEEGKQDEVANVRFVQNRLVMFHSDYPHRSWGNHGKNLEDGRLTINGFCNYR